MNICLDYSNKKLGVIALLNDLKVKVNGKLVEAMTRQNKDELYKREQTNDRIVIETGKPLTSLS